MPIPLSETCLREQLRAFVREAFLVADDAPFEDGTSLLASGILDSTGVLELVTHLEQAYGLQILDEEIVPENLDSIDLICRFLRERVGS